MSFSRPHPCPRPCPSACQVRERLEAQAALRRGAVAAGGDAAAEAAAVRKEFLKANSRSRRVPLPRTKTDYSLVPAKTDSKSKLRVRLRLVGGACVCVWGGSSLRNIVLASIPSPPPPPPRPRCSLCHFISLCIPSSTVRLVRVAVRVATVPHRGRSQAACGAQATGPVHHSQQGGLPPVQIPASVRSAVGVRA